MSWRLEIRNDGPGNDGPGTDSPFSNIRNVFVSDFGLEITARRSRDSWEFLYCSRDLQFKFSAVQSSRLGYPTNDKNCFALGPDCQVYIQQRSFSRDVLEWEKKRCWEEIVDFLTEVSRIAKTKVLITSLDEDLKPLLADRIEVFKLRTFGDLLPVESFQLWEGPLKVYDQWLIGDRK
jgi:hypothetical protein